MIKKEKTWFPIELSNLEKDALIKLKNSLPNTLQKLNFEVLKSVDDRVTNLLKDNIDIIIDRNSLPNLSHLICGWGNFVYNSVPIINKMEDFIFYKKNIPYIKQCDPEGDFHPWQSLAYASMAGVNFKDVNIKDYSLKDLAFNSVWINKNKGEELGHLLFAFANNYENKDLKNTFYLEDEQHNLEELVLKAIDAHDYGGFEVCRKFHLAEGLCAITSKLPHLAKYKPDAQRFLDGQNEMVGLIQLIFEQILSEDGDTSLIMSLREKLVILNYFENHIYYLGHAIENACLGMLNGFKIDMVQFNLMIKAVNTANQFLFDFGLDSISFLESFLSLGHYRRASFLMLEISNNIDENLNISTEFNINQSLKNYTIELDNLKLNSDTYSESMFSSEKPKEYFLFSVKGYSVLPRLDNILKNKILKEKHLELKGGFEHFRRYHPNSWPRTVHYEIIQYKNNNSIGIELHIEDIIYKDLFSILEELYHEIKENPEGINVSVDESWYNCGRLKMIFDESFSDNQIISSFVKLIEISEEKISTELMALEK